MKLVCSKYASKLAFVTLDPLLVSRDDENKEKWKS